jgi:hypothetical protein
MAAFLTDDHFAGAVGAAFRFQRASLPLLLRVWERQADGGLACAWRSPAPPRSTGGQAAARQAA